MQLFMQLTKSSREMQIRKHSQFNALYAVKHLSETGVLTHNATSNFGHHKRGELVDKILRGEEKK